MPWAPIPREGVNMKLFLDCEWDGWEGQLISMAIVSEQDHEWYEVAIDYATDDWVKQNVIPLLGKGATSYSQLQSSLFLFLNQFDTIHIVADWPEDISHFCKALIMSAGKRTDTPPLTMEVVRIDCKSDVPHNALADARGIKKRLIKI